MKKTIISGLAMFVGLSAFAQQKITFKGKVTDIPTGYTVYLYNNILGVTDSSKVENGTFEISVPFQHPSRYLFYSSYDMKVKKGHVPFGILIDKPMTVDIALKLDAGFSKSKVSGSAPQALYEELEATLEKGQDKGAVLASFVSANAQSYAAAFALDRLGEYLPAEQRKTLYDKFPAVLQQSYEGNRIADRITGELGSKVGGTAPAFVLKDQNDNDVSLAQFKGKYVFLDFWASWCGPCREEFPFIKKAYAKYKSKNFEVIGISTDKNHSAWIKAINSLELPWQLLIDNSGNKAIALSKYAVSVLPTSFLIDPDGKIIAKDLRGEQLEKELEKLLN
ncbi:MAG: AhpC/TSA family protein [Sphingobacterium sp.]|jgi:peroxiredoxin|nr:AhpC/TSA family protein [Sphingobacterium sp.]